MDGLGHEYQEAQTQWAQHLKELFSHKQSKQQMVQWSKLPPRRQDASVCSALLPSVCGFYPVAPWVVAALPYSWWKGKEWMHGCVAPSTCWTISLDSPETSRTSPFQSYRKERDTLVLFCGFYSRGGQKNVVVNPYSLFQGLHTHPKIRGDFQWKQKP